MLVTRDLGREGRSEYLDAISDELRNEQVSILVSTPTSAPAAEARMLALQAVSTTDAATYSRVAVARGGAHVPSVPRHLVDHPTRIAVDSRTSLAPTLIEIDDAEGIRTAITIHRAAAFAG